MRTWVLGALLLVAAGCSNSGSTSPTTPGPTGLNLTGTWATTIAFEDISARMTWTLTQAAAGVTGPVTVALPTGTVLLNGFLTGTLAGTSLDYTITVAPGGIPRQPSCGGQLKGTMTASATTLVGPMGVTSSNCTVPIAAQTITLTRQ